MVSLLYALWEKLTLLPINVRRNCLALIPEFKERNTQKSTVPSACNIQFACKACLTEGSEKNWGEAAVGCGWLRGPAAWTEGGGVGGGGGGEGWLD